MEALLSINQIAEPIVEKLMAHEMKLSYSALSHFKESPKDFIDYKLKKVEQTDAMLYGSMVHCLVLEPNDFDNRYLFVDESQIMEQLSGNPKPRATKIYREWFQDQLNSAGDRIVCSPVQYQHAKIVSENVLYNRASRKILDLCPAREQKIEWEYVNFLWHGFKDGSGENDIFDLKTMPDAQQQKAQATIIREGYYLQAAMYLTGEGRDKDYHIIAVDTKGGVSVHTLNERLLRHGKEEYSFLVKKFNECILEDAWDQSYDFWSKRWDGLFECDKSNWMYSND